MDPDYVGFPLISLPAVPRRIIFGFFDSGDLFDISLCSKRMTEMIMHTRTAAKRHSIVLTTNLTSVQVEYVKERRILIWDFTDKPELSELTEKRKIGNVLFENCQKVRHSYVELDTITVSYPDVQRGAIEVIKHICNIFPGPIELEFSVAFSSDFAGLFANQEFHQLQSLTVYGSIMLKKMLKQVFDKVRIQKKLFVEPETDDEYPIMQALEVDDLHLANAKWMSRELLVQLNVKTGVIQDHFFGWKDFEAFGKSWIERPKSKIERIQFGWEDRLDILELDGLEGHKWRPKEREKNYLCLNENNEVRRIDCSRGIDIVRKSDGMLATFVLYQDNLNFLVWHERHPEKKRIEGIRDKILPFYKKLEEINSKYTESSSLERLLSNPGLSYEEFVDTYRILRSMDGEYQTYSAGRNLRREVFDSIYGLIDWQDNM
ncbi:unnamed protein product [Caenorhabditis brenneri]